MQLPETLVTDASCPIYLGAG